MPSFPSYYLNNLERKRQRSRELREGLNEGMAGVLGGVDRLAQMQAALEEKGLRAEALKHGRDIEAKNQERADQRFAWEGEDRERRNAQNDQRYWLELQKNATQGNAALGGEPASTSTAPGESSGDVLAKMQSYLSGESERPGGPQTEEPPPMSVYDLDKAAEVAEEGEPETTTSDILARMESTLSESRPMAPPIVPSNADRIEEERLRAAQLKNQILERKATTPTAPKPKAAPRPAAAPTVKVEPTADWEKIDKQDARKLREAKTSAVGAVESAKAMLAILDDPEQAKFIGKYRGALESLKEDVGIGSEASGLRAGMAARFNEYKNRISGAAVSDKEKPDLTRVMPDDIDINPDDLRQKLIEGIKYAERQRDLSTKILNAGTTKALDEPSDVSAADPQTAFMQMVLDLRKQLGRKPTKEEIQSAAQAAGVVIE